MAMSMMNKCAKHTEQIGSQVQANFSAQILEHGHVARASCAQLWVSQLQCYSISISGSQASSQHIASSEKGD